MPKSKIKPTSEIEKKAHPWRPCPLGKHWVSEHARKRKTEQGKAYIQNVRGHCRINRSHHDHLYRDDIQEIAANYFLKLTGPPAIDNFEFYAKGNQYDHLIRGWTQYWNEVLKPTDPLDPDIIKALIASESSFNPKAWNHRKGKECAYGLMQVLNKTVQLLKNSKELSDHFINLDETDMTDPNLAICAGIRWLFRKKQIIERESKQSISWREAVIKYKKADARIIENFDKYYNSLKRKK